MINIVESDDNPIPKAFQLPYNWNWLNFSFNETQFKDYGHNDALADLCFQDMFGKVFATESLENRIKTNEVSLVTINCPIFHWIVQNPLYLPTVKALRMVPRNLTLEEYGFYAVSYLAQAFLSRMDVGITLCVEDLIKQWKENEWLVIGLQIRTGIVENDGRFLDEKQIEAVWKCAKELLDVSQN